MWKSWNDLCSYMIKNSSFPGEFYQTFPEENSVKFSLPVLICLLNKIEKRIDTSVLLGKSFNLTLFGTLLITSTFCRDKAPTPFPLKNNMLSCYKVLVSKVMRSSLTEPRLWRVSRISHLQMRNPRDYT